MKTRRRAGRRLGASSAFRGRLGPLLPVLLLVVAGAGCYPRPLAPAGLSEVHRKGRGHLGWTVSGSVSTSHMPWNRCGGTAVDMSLKSPEGRNVDLRCCRRIGPREVQYQGERWTLNGLDLDCTLRQGETELGTFVVRRRDDRRLVGLLQTDGVPVRVGASERMLHSDGTLAWELTPTGNPWAWELAVDGRLVGVVGKGLLQADPDLTPEQRRSVGLAGTILTALPVTGGSPR